MARFSFWGHFIVAAIVLTGAVNIALTTGRPPIPPDTPYRALLDAKIVVVAIMISLPSSIAMFSRHDLSRAVGRSRFCARPAWRRSRSAPLRVALVSVFALLDPSVGGAQPGAAHDGPKFTTALQDGVGAVLGAWSRELRTKRDRGAEHMPKAAIVFHGVGVVPGLDAITAITVDHGGIAGFLEAMGTRTDTTCPAPSFEQGVPAALSTSRKIYPPIAIQDMVAINLHDHDPPSDNAHHRSRPPRRAWPAFRPSPLSPGRRVPGRPARCGWWRSGRVHGSLPQSQRDRVPALHDTAYLRSPSTVDDGRRPALVLQPARRFIMPRPPASVRAA